MSSAQLNLVRRWLALVRGIVWFVLLIFGGIGLVLGPLGWTAAAAGRRFPRLSAALLVVPAAVLAAGWAPEFLSRQPSPNAVVSAGIVLVLVAPALVAAVLIVRGTQPVTFVA